MQVFSQEPNREFNLKKRRQNSEKTKTDLLLTSEKNSLQRLSLKADDNFNSDRSTKQAYFSELNSMRKMLSGNEGFKVKYWKNNKDGHGVSLTHTALFGFREKKKNLLYLFRGVLRRFSFSFLFFFVLVFRLVLLFFFLSLLNLLQKYWYTYNIIFFIL